MLHPSVVGKYIGIVSNLSVSASLDFMISTIYPAYHIQQNRTKFSPIKFDFVRATGEIGHKPFLWVRFPNHFEQNRISSFNLFLLSSNIELLARIKTDKPIKPGKHIKRYSNSVALHVREKTHAAYDLVKHIIKFIAIQ